MATCRVLGMVCKFLVVAYFLFGALFLVLRYGILPDIDSYKSRIEQIASRAVGLPISIADIDAAWKGLQPQLILHDVVVHDHSGAPAVVLPQVSATLSWRTVVAGDLRFENLTIVKPDLSVLRDRDGAVWVAGLPVTRTQDNGAGADWLLSQGEIVIRDGRIRWRDDQRSAPELALDDVNLVLRNQWRRHQIALQATPPAGYAAPIDLRADFYHPSFARRISDVTRWKGTLYANLRDTDLAVWKAYVDYPWDVAQGRGSVRAWLELDHAKIADFTADLNLSHLSARLHKTLQPLQLARVSGRVSASETYRTDLADGIPTFGANGHKLHLTDFSLQTEAGDVLPPTTISESFQAATRFHPEKMLVQAKLLDLSTLSKLAERLPLTGSQRQLLSDLAPHGQLTDFTVQWQGSYPNVQSYRISGGFAGLGLQAQAARPAQPKRGIRPGHAGAPAIPGFANLSGQIDATETGGTLRLASHDAVLHLPAHFADPAIPFERLDMHGRWSIQENETLQFQIEDMEFALDGAAGSLRGYHRMSLQGKTPGSIDMTATLSRFDLRKVARYLPLQTDRSAADWISGALLDGQARDVHIVAKGELADFPFHNVKSDGKPRGEFKVGGKFDRLKVNYTPSHVGKDGKSPAWPLLEDVQGSFVIDRTRLEIAADRGKTVGVAVADVKVAIPDLLSENAALEVDGVAVGALQNFLRYVKESPVAHWSGHVTADSKATGHARLQLQFQLPLHHADAIKVNGALQFMHNDVALFPALPTVYKTSGKLAFNEKGFELHGVKGAFLNEPITIVGGTQHDGSTLVKVDGAVTASGLRKTYPQPAMQRLLTRLNGASRFTATIAVRQHAPEIVVESTLQGLSMDLPMPLEKAVTASWPLKVEILGKAYDDPLVQHDEIKVSLGSVMSAHYRRHKELGRHGDWQVTSGGIGFGQPAPQPVHGLAVHADVKTINIDQWVSFYDSLGNEPGGSLKAESGLHAYLEPDVIAGRATELRVMGKKLDNVVLGASHQKQTWQVNLASEQASGYATWDEPGSGGNLGRVTARLATLNIPQGAGADGGDILGGNVVATRIPALDIVAEDFQLFGKKLGRLELNASNVRVSVGSEWRIDKLTLINADAELRAAGKWTTVGKRNMSNLTYALDIADAGKLLERFGFLGVVRGGKGKLDGDISWKGLPFSLDIPSLAGQVHLDMQAGQFLKVDPGAAKLLGVLNLQALPRRLVLDFRDVFSEGFAFDHIVGTAAVAQGIVTTDNLKMTGVAASVLMSGAADIAKESQNLHLVVIPEINLGTASVVAMAINPVVGVGTFLAQLFLRNPLIKSLTYEYNVTGSWSEPIVTKQALVADTAGKPVAK